MHRHEPAVSVVVPTYQNVAVLQECLASWRRFGPAAVEIIVVEDGCTDGTVPFLDELCATAWGAATVRVLHESDAHELRCTNRGMAVARAPLILAWQDDMFLTSDTLVPELIRTFASYPEIGMVALSRGLCFPVCDEPINERADLERQGRTRSTVGPRWVNWLRLQEVDGVIRPWAVRNACLAQTGLLDEAFVPTEWDETDLAFRVRRAGWRIATHAYERLGYYRHLGSTTLGRTWSDAYEARVLHNGRLFFERWSDEIRASHARPLRQWQRRAGWRGWLATLRRMTTLATARMTQRAVAS